MPKLELSENYMMVQSERGKIIVKSLIEMISDHKFWSNPSGDQIADRILSILSKDEEAPLFPKKSKKQAKIEAFLIGQLLDGIKSYYHSPATLQGFRRIDEEKPECFRNGKYQRNSIIKTSDKTNKSLNVSLHRKEPAGFEP